MADEELKHPIVAIFVKQVSMALKAHGKTIPDDLESILRVGTPTGDDFFGSPLEKWLRSDPEISAILKELGSSIIETIDEMDGAPPEQISRG